MNENSNRNWIWGVFFIVCAVLVILNGFGILNLAKFLWKILFTLFFLMVYAECKKKNDVSGKVICLAILFVMWRNVIGLGFISLGSIIISVILLLIGLSFLNKPEHPNMGKEEVLIEENTDNIVHLKGAFNTSSHYLRGQSVESVYLTPSFCSMSVYFDQLGLQKEEIDVILDCGFCDLKLYIPKKWGVRNEAKTLFGSIQTQGMALPQNEHVIVLKGEVNFASVHILRI